MRFVVASTGSAEPAGRSLSRWVILNPVLSIQAAIALSGTLSALPAGRDGSPTSAAVVYELTKEAFFDSKRQVFRETFVRGKQDQSSEPCFNWTVGVLHSALNALAESDSVWREELKSFLPFAASYFNPKGPVAGFDVLPGPSFPNDRYYDDNAWVAMVYADSYRLLGEESLLQNANRARDFAYSGWDEQLGGGVFWKEREKQTKNTCSNGPTAAAILAIDAFKTDPAWLAKAEAIFRWTNRTLQDPKDNLFWDNVDLGGRKEKTKWSYNTALMLRTAKELFRTKPTPELEQYIADLERAAVQKWVRVDGTIDDELQFAHLLLENLEERSLATRCGSLERVRDKLLSGSAGGYFGTRWGVAPKPSDPIKLIHQASAIRALAILEAKINRRNQNHSHQKPL